MPGAGPAAVVVLGLLSALTWGAADFGGGVLSRRAPVVGVVLVSQAAAIAFAFAGTAVRGEGLPAGPDLAWSAASGVAAAVGILALYAGLAAGPMGVVAPVTGALAAVVPAVFATAVGGPPGPLVLAGIVLAVVAVVVVARGPAPGAVEAARGPIVAGITGGVVAAVVAGTALGSFSILISHVSDGLLFGPLAVVRSVEAAFVACVVVLGRRPWRVPGGLLGPILAIGVLDMAGNAFFILAAQSGRLDVAAVLSSLYPVATVLLAAVILRERLGRSHLAGIGLAGLAIALIGLGRAA